MRILVFICESRGCKCSIAESLEILPEQLIDRLETRIKEEATYCLQVSDQKPVMRYRQRV